MNIEEKFVNTGERIIILIIKNKIYKKLICCVILFVLFVSSCSENIGVLEADIAVPPTLGAAVSDNYVLDIDLIEEEPNKIYEADKTEEADEIDNTENIEEVTEAISEEPTTEEPTEELTESISEKSEDSENAVDEIIDETAEINDIIYSDENGLVEILISAVGDVSLASNYVKPYANSFYNYYDLYGATYFFENVQHIFSSSDVTVANLESALTDSDEYRLDKRYCYRGYKEYANILVEGSIDVVNLENNHIFDYSQEGYNDTIEALKDVGVDYFGNGVRLIKEVKGVKIGFIGFMGSSDVSNYRLQRLKNDLLYLDENGADIKIVSFHWGIVDEITENNNQRILGHFAVDNGADLVLGHHPHVLQGIENYNGKYIVYSLGNFIFDGNVISNIEHRTSIIFQQKFILRDNVIVDSEINIIPVYTISSSHTNNFQPVIVDGDRKEQILQKIEERSIE